jgi:mRNA interferase HicA
VKPPLIGLPTAGLINIPYYVLGDGARVSYCWAHDGKRAAAPIETARAANEVLPFGFDEERGKGSHGTLYFGDHFTVLKDRRAEISPGLLHAMLRQLGLSERDLR